MDMTEYGGWLRESIRKGHGRIFQLCFRPLSGHWQNDSAVLQNKEFKDDEH